MLLPVTVACARGSSRCAEPTKVLKTILMPHHVGAFAEQLTDQCHCAIVNVIAQILLERLHAYQALLEIPGAVRPKTPGSSVG